MSLPSPRCVITTHAEDGTSIISTNAIHDTFKPFGPAGSGFAIFHKTSTVPTPLLAPLPPLSSHAATIPRPEPEGAIFALADYAPGAKVPLHRTESCDYGIVLKGSVWLILDGGEEVEVKEGEMLVQRGTKHGWENRGGEVCRVAFVMLGGTGVVAEDVKIGK